MTIPPLSNPITYWSIAIINDGFYNGWNVWDHPWGASVSAKGYPALKLPAQFETKGEAEEFFTRNRKIIDARCASKVGFEGFKIVSGKSYWPIKYDKPVSLRTVGKRGKGVHTVRRDGLQ